MDGYRNCIYGGLSGLMMGTLLQPLEILKTNMMMSIHSHKSILEVSLYIHFKEGLKGFYRGLSPALVKLSIASSVYFTVLQKLRSLVEKETNATNFVASWTARCCSAIITNPLAVIRTRQEMIGFNQYMSIYDGIRSIYYQEGIRNGIFRGGLSSFLMNGPFAGIYFVFYTKFKAYTNNSFLSGIGAGIMATVATNPLDLVRARLQYQYYGNYKYNGISDAFVTIIRQEGFLSGLFKGVQPRLIKKPIIYEFLYHLVESESAF